MDERRQGFLRTVLAGTIDRIAPTITRRAGAQHDGHNASPETASRSAVGLWQPGEEVDPTSLRGGRGPPCRSSSHVVRDNLSAPHRERKWRRKP